MNQNFNLAKVYPYRDINGYYKECNINDIIGTIGHDQFRMMGMKVDNDGIIKRHGSIGTWTPWHHIKHACTKRCGLDHQIKFNFFKFIPPKCLECWKVTVSPRSLGELFTLLQLEKELDKPSKCGIELRDYTPRHYGGYFYNNSLDEARERYKEVREAINDTLGPEVGVVLKRGCTEFEMIKGPSAFWHLTPEEQYLNDYIDDRYLDERNLDSKQPDYLLSGVHKRWIEWAHSHGDWSYLEYTNGKKLYPDTVSYQDDDLSEIKTDLAAARALQLSTEKKPEKINEILSNLQKLAEKFNIGVEQFSHFIGHNYKSPLFPERFEATMAAGDDDIET